MSESTFLNSRWEGDRDTETVTKTHRLAAFGSGWRSGSSCGCFLIFLLLQRFRHHGVKVKIIVVCTVIEQETYGKAHETDTDTENKSRHTDTQTQETHHKSIHNEAVRRSLHPFLTTAANNCTFQTDTQTEEKTRKERRRCRDTGHWTCCHTHTAVLSPLLCRFVRRKTLHIHIDTLQQHTEKAPTQTRRHIAQRSACDAPQLIAAELGKSF